MMTTNRPAKDGRFVQAISLYLKRQFAELERPWQVSSAKDEETLTAVSPIPPAELRMLESRNGAESVQRYYDRIVSGMTGDLREVSANHLDRPIGRVTFIIDPVRRERRIVLQMGAPEAVEGPLPTTVMIL